MVCFTSIHFQYKMKTAKTKQRKHLVKTNKQKENFKICVTVEHFETKLFSVTFNINFHGNLACDYNFKDKKKCVLLILMISLAKDLDSCVL